VTSSVPFCRPDSAPASALTVARLLREAADSNKFLLAESVAALERALCERTGWAFAAACASHAGALILAGRALGVRRGDRVAVLALSSPAVPVALRRLEAVQIPLDVTGPQAGPDPAAAQRAVREGAVGFIVSHPLAVPVPLAPLAGAVRGRGTPVLEDLSDVRGAALTGDLDGPRGDAAVIDLSPGGPLGTVGEAAAVLTNDPDVDRICRRLRNHGQDPGRRFLHYEVGYNLRMDEIVAGSAVEALTMLTAQRHRGEIAAWYARLLPRAPAIVLPALAGLSAPDAYVVLAPDRDDLRADLDAHGIEARPRDLMALPGAPRAADLDRQQLALPLHAALSAADAQRVAEQVVSHYA